MAPTFSTLAAAGLRACVSIITDNQLTLVESDQRKSVFLQTVIRELGLTATVRNERIEAIPALGAGIVTARALACRATAAVAGQTAALC